MEDDEQLLSVCRHADHRPRQAEDFSLDSSDGKEPECQCAGRNCRPAVTQTQRLGILTLWQVNNPLLIGVPGGEVEALQLTAARRLKDLEEA